MTRSRMLVVFAAALIALSGCGGSSDGKKAAPKADLSNLSATALLTKAQTQVVKEKTVSINGTGVDSGSSIEMKIDYVGSDASGSIKLDGDEMTLLNVDGTIYFKASDSFWKSQAPKQADAILTTINGRWVKADGSSDFADLLSLTKRSFLSESILKPDNAPTKGTAKTVNGVACLALVDGNKGTLYVAKDDARPIKVDSGGTGGDLTFTYGKAAIPKAPASSDVLDFATLTGS